MQLFGINRFIRADLFLSPFYVVIPCTNLFSKTQSDPEELIKPDSSSTSKVYEYSHNVKVLLHGGCAVTWEVEW